MSTRKVEWGPKTLEDLINWSPKWVDTDLPPAPVPIAIVSVVVWPPSKSVAFGASLQLEARVYGTGDFNRSVTWELVSGSGALTPGGLYTAGSEESTAVVRARSVGNPTKFADITLTIVQSVVTGHPIIRARYAVRLGGRLVIAKSSRELQAAIEKFEDEAAARAERKAAAEARTSRPRTPRRLAKTAPRVEDIEAPDAEQAALQAQMEAANARIRQTYEQAAQAALIEQRLQVEMQQRAAQDAEDMEAMTALEGEWTN